MRVLALCVRVRARLRVRVRVCRAELGGIIALCNTNLCPSLGHEPEPVGGNIHELRRREQHRQGT